MFQKFRGLPASVKFAIAGLTIFLGVAFALAPVFVSGVAVILVGVVSLVRILSYFVDGI